MTREKDSADAAANPALLIWSRLIQGAAAVVIVLSLTLLLSPRLGATFFNLWSGTDREKVNQINSLPAAIEKLKI